MNKCYLLMNSLSGFVKVVYDEGKAMALASKKGASVFVIPYEDVPRKEPRKSKYDGGFFG